MNDSKSVLQRVAFKSIFGFLLIGLAVTSICCLMIYSSENRAQYDCYVWGFNNAVCRYDKVVEKYPGYSRCPEHLVPVTLCEEFPETERGVLDAMRFIKGDLVDFPTYRRDYRTFHLNY
jgi:hypothetical protein